MCSWSNELSPGQPFWTNSYGLSSEAAPLPVAARVVRPVSRVAAKASPALYEKSHEALAEAGEILDDLAAEVHAELQNDDAIEQGQHAARKAAQRPLRLVARAMLRFNGGQLSPSTVAGLALLVFSLSQFRNGQILPPAASKVWAGLRFLHVTKPFEAFEVGDNASSSADP